ncbi:hypothetical protein C4573_00155 [Candidatus Woesearchaeota archaeon]|nr:MAG: hypothetical protein C4573_00155 [Candidatus Woesearchaeota archaeon]
MIINAIDKEILAFLSKHTVIGCSINQIALALHKAYPHINAKVNVLLQERILKKNIIGKSHVCFLNLRNPITRYALAIIETEKARVFLSKHSEIKKTIKQVIKEHTLQTIFALPESVYMVTDETFFHKKIKNVSKSELVQITMKHKDITVLYKPENYYSILKKTQT